MILRLYGLLMRCLQPVLRRKLARRAVLEPGYSHAIQERFGRYSQPPWPDDGKTIWVHAVSLGETRAAAVLLERLRKHLPGMRLLLTSGTATGRTEGERLLTEEDVQVWQPWDTPEAVRAFLDHFHPRLGILMETEVWPNMTAQCASADVPLVLANARMSEKSLRKSLSFGWLVRPAYQRLKAVWAQTEDDAARLRQLGAPVKAVLGNLKFDATPDSALLARGRIWRAASAKPVLMLASSREGEEQDLLHWLTEQPQAMQAVQCLIVPRHPQRFAEVASLALSHGFSVSARSSWQERPSAADIWLGDSLGEMASYYGLSDAALLGGSFASLGGQNLIEAAACACPVLMGPHTFNFSEVAELALRAGAAMRCNSLAEAAQTGVDLLADTARCRDMANAASRFAKAHQGAAHHTAAQIRSLLTWPARR